MIETLPTTTIPAWDSNDAKLLRDTLAGENFRKALRLILEDRPELLDGSDVNRTLVRNGEVKGFDAAITAIFKLTFEQPEARIASQTYPDLDDERAWENPTE